MRETTSPMEPAVRFSIPDILENSSLPESSKWVERSPASSSSMRSVIRRTERVIPRMMQKKETPTMISGVTATPSRIRSRVLRMPEITE